MEFGDMVKSQMLTMGMMKQSSEKGGDSSMIQMVMGLILMQIVEFIMKAIPEIIKFVKALAKEYFDGKKKDYEDNLFNIVKKDVKSSVVFSLSESNFQDNVIQSILNYICTQNSTIKLRFSGSYIANNREIFDLNHKDTKCKIKEIEFKEEKLDKLVFEIYSEKMSLREMRMWIDEIHKNFMIDKKNKLGTNKYYFDEVPVIPPKDPDGGYRLNSAPKTISFTMTKFRTNKSLSNIFGPEIEPIKKMVDLFMHNPEWYEKRGIPKTLGFLLYGPPGTGKTSTIKAIAKDTNKHIVNLQLRPTTTQNQLRSLFFSETITVLEKGNSVSYDIPLNQRIYVLEDVDCLTDVVLSRGSDEMMDNFDNGNVKRLLETPENDNNKNLSDGNQNYLRMIKELDDTTKTLKEKEYIKMAIEHKYGQNHKETQGMKENLNQQFLEEFNFKLIFPNGRYLDKTAFDAKITEGKNKTTKIQSTDERNADFQRKQKEARSNTSSFLGGMTSDIFGSSLGGHGGPATFNVVEPVADSASAVSSDKKENQNPDELNLSFLLNLLDGILEVPDRIIVMTSNHPEKLDSALIRPGRIDLIVKFGKCANTTITQMFHFFFETNEYTFPEWCSDKITPAKLSQILGSNYEDQDSAYREIMKICE